MKDEMLCANCGKDLVQHHWRNLRCPGRKSIYNAKRIESVAILPDGSAFFVAEVDTSAPPDNPIKWNPFNKVVQDHRDGTIDYEATNVERAQRGLPVPWKPELGDVEARLNPVY